MGSSYVYTGNPINPKYTINIGDKVLEKDVDFDLEITDNINVGTAHVIIKGKGKFKGVMEKTFEIIPAPARSLAFFADNTEFIYDGEPCEMKLAVKFGDVTLKEGTDYTIEYQNNDRPGKATARVMFQGNFTGVMSIPFNISESGEEKTVKKLRNISMISADEIVHGSTVTVMSAAKGGSGEYKFAVFYKKVESEKWVTVHGYNDEPEAVIKPKSCAHYRICVKAKDSEGSISKKYFDVNVVAPKK